MKQKAFIFWVVILFIGGALGVGLGFSIKSNVASAQTAFTKEVVTLAPTLDPQVKVSDITVGTTNLGPSQEFDGPPKWIEDLKFRVTNTSDKTIEFIQINVNFPETRKSGNLMSYTMGYGELKGRKLRGGDKRLWKPGETIDVEMSKEIDQVKKFVESRQPMESLKQVEIEIGLILFTDKTGWEAGTKIRQDARDPNSFIPVN